MIVSFDVQKCLSEDAIKNSTLFKRPRGTNLHVRLAEKQHAACIKASRNNPKL